MQQTLSLHIMYKLRVYSTKFFYLSYNSILKSRIDKVLRACKDDDEKYISTGSCRLCKPCHKKLNEPCAHPDIRTFSYEALGVNVSSMVHDIFGIDLLWYAKGSLPLYTCVVAGLLSNQMMLDDRISSFNL